MTLKYNPQLHEAEQYYARVLEVSKRLLEMEKQFRKQRVPTNARHAAIKTAIRLYRAGHRGSALKKALHDKLLIEFPEIDWDKWLPIIWEIIKFVVPLLVFFVL